MGIHIGWYSRMNGEQNKELRLVAQIVKAFVSSVGDAVKQHDFRMCGVLKVCVLKDILLIY
jgi:hypothetical protein